MVKRLKKRISNFKQQKTFEKILDIFYYSTIIIGFIMGAIFSFNLMDSTPASPDDFKPLYEQKEVLETNFYSVLEMENATIYFSDDFIEATLSSEECSLLLHFNKDFKFISSEEIDKSISIPIVILGSTFFGFLCMAAFLILFLILVGAFLFFSWITMRLTEKLFKTKNLLTMATLNHKNNIIFKQKGNG